MALLHLESFDYANAYTGEIATRYPSPGGGSSFVITPAVGRRGTAAIDFQGSTSSLTKVVTPSDATVITGFARQMQLLPTGDDAMFRVLDSTGVVHVRIAVKTDGSVVAHRGDGTTQLGISSAGAIDTASGYHAIEIKITIHDSAGVVVVKVNGTTVLNLSSQDTRNAGDAGYSRVQIGKSNNAGQLRVDDWWVCDGTGSVNNDFKGDQRVDCQYPNANGSNNGSTPSTGSDRSATTDETDPNNDTDYNTITNVGDKDTLAIQDLVNAGGTLAGVQVSLWAKKTDAGAGSICHVARQGGVDFDGASFPTDVNYGYFTKVYDLAPDGTAWDETKFNAIEFGYKRTA